MVKMRLKRNYISIGIVVILLILSMFILKDKMQTLSIISEMSPSECYQEDADIPAICENVVVNEAGTYTSIGSVIPETTALNIVYKKPVLAKSAKWIVKHGTLEAYSVNVPSDCFNNDLFTLKFRFINIVRKGQDRHYSYGQCFNGNWKTITETSETTGFYEPLPTDYYSEKVYLTHDKNWDSHAELMAVPAFQYISIKNIDEINKNVSGAFLYEEAVIWDMKPNPISLQVEEKPEGFYGQDYSFIVKVDYDGIPRKNVLVKAKLTKDNTLLSETSCLTDDYGLCNINLNNVLAEGFIGLKVETSIVGINQKYEKTIFFNPFTDLIIKVIPFRSSYRYQEDVGASIFVTSGGQPYKTSLDVRIIDSKGSIIDELTTITDNEGEAIISFERVEAIGLAKITAQTTTRGKIFSGSSSQIIFEGNPFVTRVTAESQVQYNTQPLVFFVNIQDTYGRAITPQEITSIKGRATLSQGNINQGAILVTYQGSGNYRVEIPKSAYSGFGSFNGRIDFNYNNLPISSDSITLEVRQDRISIGTSNIEPFANIDIAKTFKLSFASESGRLIDPDNIFIEVSFPSGIGIETIPFSSFKKVSTGVYEFTYDNFKEVEKYSFDIYADKSGYSRGNAKASVSVEGTGVSGGGMAGTPIIGILVSNVYYIIGGIFVLIIAIYFVRKKYFKKK